MSVVIVTYTVGIHTTLWSHAPCSPLVVCREAGALQFSAGKTAIFPFLYHSEIHLLPVQAFASLHTLQIAFLLKRLLTLQPEELRRPLTVFGILEDRQTDFCSVIVIFSVHGLLPLS